MGILDSIKKATRIGLSHDEFYNLAYEQGVLVNNWVEAVNLFGQAAERYARQGNPPMYHRALANQLLYHFALTRDQWDTAQYVALIDALVPHLREIPEIEVLGSQTDGIPTSALIDELLGYKYWRLAADAGDDHARVYYHTQAAEAFDHLGDSLLVIDRNLSARDPYYLHSGLAKYFQAQQLIDGDPAAAVDRLQEAYNNLRNCKIKTEFTPTILHEIDQLNAREVCWFCGREVQGNERQFRYYPYRTTPYLQRIFEANPVEGRPAQRPDQGIPLCLACGSAFEQLADEYARRRSAEFANQLRQTIDELRAEIQTLTRQVHNLEHAAHQH